MKRTSIVDSVKRTVAKTMVRGAGGGGGAGVDPTRSGAKTAEKTPAPRTGLMSCGFNRDGLVSVSFSVRYGLEDACRLMMWFSSSIYALRGRTS